MKITGNENGKAIANNFIDKKELEQFNEVIGTTRVLFDSIGIDIVLKSSDYEKGDFEIGLVVNVLKETPSINISIDNSLLAKDLFYNSNKSDDNRKGILEYLKQGLVSSIDTAFKNDLLIHNLNLLDEKLKSKTQEVREMDISNNNLSKIMEVPQLVTGENDEVEEVEEEVEEVETIEEELPFPEVEKLDIKASIDEGYSYSDDYEDEDDEVPSNYKPLSDSTNDNHSVETIEEGTLENIGKIKH